MKGNWFLALARLFLILDALIFLMVGTFLLTDPASLPYIDLDSASALTAIRTWGGMFIGVGIVGLIAGLNRSHIRPGLIIMLIISSMIVLVRLYGINVDGVEPRQLNELRDESLGPVLALVGLLFFWLHQRSSERSNPNGSVAPDN
ncbi:MAG: DUF4345 domain-containing protein [Gammaproteobacteria bacterium]|nr:DUF4345 domain-containing protein [Gammaproteobacteria bacterium]